MTSSSAAGRFQGSNNSVPISGAVLGVAGIAAGTLLGLKGMQVGTEEEIAPVLDTAEAAGASHEDLARLEALIRHNVENGIEVVFSPEYGTGIMGQYDSELNQIVITPETLDQGLEMTMKTLLHETTHAQQDAIAGLDNGSMGTVGIDPHPGGVDYVQENYEGLDPHTHALEIEANSSEFRVEETFDQFGIDV
jgi:hypothetical protein